LTFISAKSVLNSVGRNFKQSDTADVLPKKGVTFYKSYVAPSALAAQDNYHKPKGKKKNDELMISARNHGRKDDKESGGKEGVV